MTSDHTTNPDHVDTHNLANCDDSARLGLKPHSFARGALDGAWWPRSTDPAIELAALIEAVGVPIRWIALTKAEWDSAPRRIRLASGRKIAVDWLQTGDVRMIRIIDTNYQRIDLFVIPVDTTPAIAELALRMATDGHDPDTTAAGSHHSAPGCHPTKAEVPGNEEGAPDHHAPDRASGNPPSGVVGRRRRVVLLPHGPAEHIDLHRSRSEAPSA